MSSELDYEDPQLYGDNIPGTAFDKLFGQTNR